MVELLEALLTREEVTASDAKEAVETASTTGDIEEEAALVRTDADSAALVSALAEDATAFATEAFEAAAATALEDTVGAYVGLSGLT